MFWAGSAVVVLGASVVGTVLGARSHSQEAQTARATALATFMRENHALLLHDVAMARGPLFDAWARDLGLGAMERRRVATVMEGSREQGQLLEALDGPIDAGRALRFSSAYFRVTERALGRERTRGIVVRATTAMTGPRPPGRQPGLSGSGG